MSRTVRVSPIPPGELHSCQAERGRMSRNGGRCTNPASYFLSNDSETLVTFCCGQHLRSELDLLGSMIARAERQAIEEAS